LGRNDDSTLRSKLADLKEKSIILGGGRTGYRMNL